MVKDRSVQLTEGGKARLEEELRHLTTVKRPGLAQRIQDATEHGDISDNSEYEELKEELVMTDARIRDLEQTLQRAEIIRRDPKDDSVGLGSTVTLRGEDGEVETWVLVSPEEANTLDGTISTESPVGRALIGCHAGDSPTVATPGGSYVYTVLQVA